jgi:DNA-binding transcriptional ArsR family regulator
MESMNGTHSRVAALRELLHPERMRAFSALHRRPMSRLELQADLKDVSSTTLFRHLTRMVDVGLIHVVNERPSGPNREKLYEAIALDLNPEESAELSADDYVAIVAVLSSELIHNVREAAFSTAGLWGRSTFGSQIFSATDAEYRDIQERFDAFLGDLERNFAPEPGRTRRSLTYGICPQEG